MKSLSGILHKNGKWLRNSEKRINLSKLKVEVESLKERGLAGNIKFPTIINVISK